MAFVQLQSNTYELYESMNAIPVTFIFLLNLRNASEIRKCHKINCLKKCCANNDATLTEC